ncbi:MAG: hypothetical protein N3A01_09015 [Bacteroidales bacterium]|nr:hypothetical protein [Bacteroidales bacterium]
MKKLFLIPVILALVAIFFTNCSRECKHGLGCILPDGTVIGREENNQIKLFDDKSILKLSVIQAGLQLFKVQNLITDKIEIDSIMFNGMEIINEPGELSLIGYLKVKNVNVSIQIPLEKDNEKNLKVKYLTNDSGKKIINGCMSLECNKCKYTNQSGCNCIMGAGKCGHVVIEIPILF